MGTKITFSNITSDYTSAEALNSLFDLIETELDKCLYRDGTAPNQMEADLDMNSNDILNAADIYADDIIVDGVSLMDQVNAAAASAAAAAASESAAAASASAAASSAADAAAAATGSGAGVAGLWTFSTTTSMADPGAGVLRLNNATLSSVTAIAVDATTADTGNPDYSDFFASMDDTDQGAILRIVDRDDSSNFAIYNVTSVTDNTGWLQLSCSHVASAGTIADGADLSLDASIGGNDGGGSGTVTSVAIADSGASEITVTGSPITSSGTINLGIANIAGTKITYSGGGNLDAAVVAKADATGGTITSPTIATSVTFDGVTYTGTTGSVDVNLVSGTAGTANNLAMWDANGDLVDSSYGVLDEDTMSSDSATDLATQQSIKAYVDAQVGGTDSFADELFHVQDQKSSGTDAGTFTSGAWRTRTLNTTLTNDITSASLSSNQVSLPAGTYYAKGKACFYDTRYTQLRLQNVTDGTTEILGLNAYSNTSSAEGHVSLVEGQFTLAGTKLLELQHRCSLTGTTYGFGRAAGWGTEVYADLQIWKIG